MDRATGDQDEVTLESLERKYGSQPPHEPESEPGPEQPPEGGWYADTPHEPSGTDGLGVKALRVTLWIVAVVAALYVGSIFWDGLEAAGYHGDDSQRWIAFGGLAALAASILALTWSYRSGRRREDLMVTVGLVALVLAMLGFAVYNSRNSNDQLVEDYCAYGARSLAQYGGCVEHVEPGQVVYSDTPAADFANGKRDDCGPGAGPLCGEAAFGREAREALNELERSP